MIHEVLKEVTERMMCLECVTAGFAAVAIKEFRLDTLLADKLAQFDGVGIQNDVLSAFLLGWGVSVLAPPITKYLRRETSDAISR